MLSFQDFFAACAGLWKSDRIYHSILENEVERSYTEFRAESLTPAVKQQMLAGADAGSFAGIQIDLDRALAEGDAAPGFAISFETRSETGEEVSMSLKALFVPDACLVKDTLLKDTPIPLIALPIAAQIAPDEAVIQGYYLRDKGYSEAGAIAGRFTYLPIRQTLEMTTYYNRSVAVDQMRFVTPTLRMRTIVTYQRPTDGTAPTVIDLMGFGVERKA